MGKRKKERKDARARAIKKAKAELQKDSAHATKLAKNTTFSELLYYVQLLHWIRLIDRFPRFVEQVPGDQECCLKFAPRVEESLKYLIQCCHCNGKPVFITDIGRLPYLDVQLTQDFLKIANHIHAKFELLSFFTLFDVEIHGERDQDVRIDLSQMEDNPEIKMCFNYALRVSAHTHLQSKDKSEAKLLMDHLIQDFEAHASQVETALGLSLDDYSACILTWISLVQHRLEAIEPSLATLPNGRIDIQQCGNIAAVSECLVFDKATVSSSCARNGRRMLELLSFDRGSYEPEELRFFQTARQPVLCYGAHCILSPELLLDSAFTNLHYHLLECPTTAEAYKSGNASAFLDRITAAAAEAGFKESAREVPVKDGRKDLGDIDLVLQGEDGRFLLIEAKAHALPLEVYFQDFDAVRKRLSYLTDEWERKVRRREGFLEDHHSEFGIDGEFRYVIVSRFPEILSHASPVLTVSLTEFKEWVHSRGALPDFDALFGEMYELKRPSYSPEQMEELRTGEFVLGDFRES